MARLVLPSGVATSFIEKHWDAGWFTRLAGFCWVGASLTRRGSGGSSRPFEVLVGHINTYLPGAVCWEENDTAFRGAVRFPLTLRDVTAGFHEREQAWLTWRRVDATPFFGCTNALEIWGGPSSIGRSVDFSRTAPRRSGTILKSPEPACRSPMPTRAFLDRRLPVYAALRSRTSCATGSSAGVRISASS